jgi:hypothetical protein
MPTVCPAIWAPVCGCDGQTYGNACEAAGAGVNVSSTGECPSGCKDNSECAASQYCAKPAGDCDGQGACEPRPQACILLYAPVCGCDGDTYSNSCFAASAGVNVAYAGECKPQGCQNSLECGPAEFCAKPTGQCGAAGTCEPTPLGCPDVWDPVCGCDGKTYSNACDAHQGGASVAYEGACCAPIDCAQGQMAVDTNGDGCPDACKLQCATDADCPSAMACVTEVYCPCPQDLVPPCLAPCYLIGTCQ